jgi:hypothetical protein
MKKQAKMKISSRGIWAFHVSACIGPFTFIKSFKPFLRCPQSEEIHLCKNSRHLQNAVSSDG